jgi:hypothetical protein
LSKGDVSSRPSYESGDGDAAGTSGSPKHICDWVTSK